ncbi:MAG: response regulator [Candidatus Margulisiibacteriota bacterium]
MEIIEKKRILAVDDEESLIAALTCRLEASNYEVIHAFDGREALSKAKGEKPDLIILDIMLPFLDGFEICRLLKFDSKYKDIPIVMLTSKVSDSDRKTGFEVGADAYLTKPYEARQLLEKIGELLN